MVADKESVLRDYRIAWESRHASLLGRREVLSGKAKFGIFGDGKEVPQLAMARAFQNGDIRSGYYRDQTFMFAKGVLNVQEFFAQLYAIPDVSAEPSSAGRSMNGHFGTRTLNSDGSWKRMTDMANSSADVSPTGSQMPRLVGLAYASRLYRDLDELKSLTGFSNNGREIAFGTIGNASCAEGMFWESVNAIGVLKSPALISIWDDGYGISVPNEFQNTKGNLSEILSGFQRKDGDTQGYDIYVVKGWDYPALVETYMKAAEKIRTEGFPAIVHVIEVTQPQGHSTSGSHERYKSKERLQWESDCDCLQKMRGWILENGLSTVAELDAIEAQASDYVKESKQRAWDSYITPIRSEIAHIGGILDTMIAQSANAAELTAIKNELLAIREPFRADYFTAIHKVLMTVRSENLPAARTLIEYRDAINALQEERYSSNLHSTSDESAARIKTVEPVITASSQVKVGFEVLNATFDYWLGNDPRVIAFGEDVGQLGDVNQGFSGMQAKYGALRVSDTGIREVTILGQAIGMAMRGLRPICEMQYLDYILYSLQLMSDDLATVQWRTKGGQKAPVIVRTRGHRLEGVWHSGSPMAGIINLVRGMYVCVPRDMTRAASFYNTLLRSDEPAIIVEVLNGYRLKETMPENIGQHTLELGVPDIMREGSDMTLVTYGATCRVAQKAADMLAECGISIEIIDVQTLLPFDIHGIIAASLRKTNRVLFVDEDVPGGTTAFMMQNVLDRDGGYTHLDSAPKALAAKPHRPAYGTDGNYWSKPEAEHIFDAAYRMMHEVNPAKYPMFYV
ncbi:MAG: transketolase [Candidatus Kapabacteria bacterium]|nr:transketolase [Candidatus Kapabacteria bacterium]